MKFKLDFIVKTELAILNDISVLFVIKEFS